MPAGERDALVAVGPDPLSEAQRVELVGLVEKARAICGYAFAVWIGPLADGRRSAVDLHSRLPGPAASVLVAVDPSARRIEVVTGGRVARVVDDRTAGFAVLAMKSCFVANDLVGGIREAVTLLAEHARQSGASG